MSAYNLDGVRIASLANSFSPNMELDYGFDTSSNANYTVLRIYRDRIDGTRQYPFVFCPNGVNAGSQSTLQMNIQYGFNIAINAGVFYTDSSRLNKPHGIVIQNGALIQQGTTALPHYALTIDLNGDMSYAFPDTDGAELISSGVISAVNAWSPIIINYEDASQILENIYGDQSNAQRQIIGQFGNGDYAIVTCEGRNYDHSDGWTMTEAKTVCKRLGLKFAFNLDGGGSTETVIGKKQINTIYEGTYGRIVPTFIVFNGKNTFSIPNA